MNIAHMIFQRSFPEGGCKCAPGAGQVPSATELSRLVTLSSGLMTNLLTVGTLEEIAVAP